MQVVGGVDPCFGGGRGGCGFGVGHVRAILPVGGWRASGNRPHRGYARIGLVWGWGRVRQTVCHANPEPTDLPHVSADP